MKKILYSIYTGEYPNQFAGGPNNIIYKILQNNNSGFQFDYLSSDLYTENLAQDGLSKIRNKRTPKKQFASFLAKKSELYRKIFSSDLYLKYHYFKKAGYFKAILNKNNNYDIIHAKDSITLSFLNKNIKKSKLILTVHSKGALSDELIHSIKNERLKKKLKNKLREYELKSVKIADIITFPSNAARTYFEESLNIKINDQKVKIIHNGIDFEEINKNIVDKKFLEEFSLTQKKNRLLLLNVASHSPEKRIDLLLDVIFLLKNKFNRDILLINIGSGPLTKELNDKVKSLKIYENTRFLGQVQNDSVIKFLKFADMLVLTSQRVIFDLVVLEALACETCCALMNDGGNKEIIVDNDNGYLFQNDDPEQIADKINSIDIEKVKINAVETAKRFSAKKMANEYFDLYRNVLD